MDNYLNSFREMLSLRGLTDHTMISYSTYISAYLQYLSDRIQVSPEELSWQKLREFLFWIQKTRGLSDRTINACISQLRFFTRYVLHKPWDPYQIPFRKFDSYTPFIPSRQEMQIFLASISDLKLKTLLCLMFSAGLRIGEVCHLKCSDIEHSRNRIHIRASKNRSDRYAQLSENAWKLILQYWYSLPAPDRPQDWLFPQKRDHSKPIDHQRVSAFIRSHEKELGWKHRFTCHTFRHAFATYHYEDGTDLLTLKALLGHRSISSTVIYVHMSAPALSAAQSPFDKMGGIFHE
ncbi:MAG: tyrosine-type recombinase/integrase [Lachnospiraceae bacterium]|nr:tyrosine-type recombinase/integrase [Lachnospiraceae bacterium]